METHLFELICETVAIWNTYYLFQYWSLEINYRVVRPLFSFIIKDSLNSSTQALRQRRQAKRSTASKEGIPAFVRLHYPNAIKLISICSEFFSYAQMNILFLQKNKTSPMFTMVLTCMPVLKIRLALKSFQRKPKCYETSQPKWFRSRKKSSLHECYLAAIKECYGLLEFPVLATEGLTNLPSHRFQQYLLDSFKTELFFFGKDHLQLYPRNNAQSLFLKGRGSLGQD